MYNSLYLKTNIASNLLYEQQLLVLSDVMEQQI